MADRGGHRPRDLVLVFPEGRFVSVGWRRIGVGAMTTAARLAALLAVVAAILAVLFGGTLAAGTVTPGLLASCLLPVAAGGLLDRLHLSIKTVEPAISSIFRKLGLDDDPASNRRVLAVVQYWSLAGATAPLPPGSHGERRIER